MDIKYLGHSSFRIKGKTGIVITDPFDPAMVGYSFPKVTADMVTVSHQHPDHNFTKGIQPAKENKPPLVINGPGEYEVEGIKIYGYPTFHDKTQGSERGKNTIYLMYVDGISILHCGDIGHTLSEQLLEEIDEVNILMVPVGGIYTINEKEAMSLLRQIEPSIVIPMHYKEEGKAAQFSELSPVASFLGEIGKAVEPLPKLTVSADKLPENTEVVVLSR